eukprot:2260660-Rhodomonas_salina.1
MWRRGRRCVQDEAGRSKVEKREQHARENPSRAMAWTCARREPSREPRGVGQNVSALRLIVGCLGCDGGNELQVNVRTVFVSSEQRAEQGDRPRAGLCLMYSEQHSRVTLPDDACQPCFWNVRQRLSSAH